MTLGDFGHLHRCHVLPQIEHLLCAMPVHTVELGLAPAFPQGSRFLGNHAQGMGERFLRWKADGPEAFILCTPRTPILLICKVRMLPLTS
jgi:hypothetical protein